MPHNILPTARQRKLYKNKRGDQSGSKASRGERKLSPSRRLFLFYWISSFPVNMYRHPFPSGPYQMGPPSCTPTGHSRFLQHSPRAFSPGVGPGMRSPPSPGFSPRSPQHYSSPPRPPAMSPYNTWNTNSVRSPSPRYGGPSPGWWGCGGRGGQNSPQNARSTPRHWGKRGGNNGSGNYFNRSMLQDPWANMEPVPLGGSSEGAAGQSAACGLVSTSGKQTVRNFQTA
uniref:M-phase-specific PLK1-interacting protein n=1 Tax=Eptatretus burgeri TaxID=7764 RepID=A0A8C4QGL9_EPTBU